MADDRNDDFTDLTDDAEETGKGQKKTDKGKKKAPPAPVEKKGPKPGKKTRDGKKKGGKIKLIIIILIVLIIAVFVAALIMNLFGVRDTVNGFLRGPLTSVMVWLDPEFSTMEESLREESDKRSTALDIRERGLDQREAEIRSRETTADDREKQLDKRSTALDKREESLKQDEATGVPVSSRVLTGQELEAYESLSRSYSNMDPEAAAKILAELHEPYDAATILFHMSERGAGAILAAMEVELAARITELLLEN